MLENRQYNSSSIPPLRKEEGGTTSRLEKGINRIVNNINHANYDMTNSLAELSMYSAEYYKKWYADNSEYAHKETYYFSDESERVKYYHSIDPDGNKILHLPLSKEMINLGNSTKDGIQVLIFVDGRLLEENLSEITLNSSNLSLLIKSDLLPSGKNIDIVYMRKFLIAQQRPYYTARSPLSKGDTIEFINPSINLSQFCEKLMVLYVKFPNNRYHVPLPRIYYNLVTDDYGMYQYANILQDLPAGVEIQLVCLAEWWEWEGELDEDHTSVPLIKGNYVAPIVDPRDCYVYMDGRILSTEEYDIAFSKGGAGDIPPSLVFKGFTPGIKNKIKIYKSLPYNPTLYLDIDQDLINNQKGMISNLNPYPEIYPLTENVIAFTSSSFDDVGELIDPYNDDNGTIIAHINTRMDARINARVAMNQAVYLSMKGRGNKLNTYEFNTMKYESKSETNSRIQKYLSKLPNIDKGTNLKTLIAQAATKTKLSGLLLALTDNGLPIDATGSLSAVPKYMDFVIQANLNTTNANIGANINDRHPAPDDAMIIDLSESPTAEPEGIGSSDISTVFTNIEK